MSFDGASLSTAVVSWLMTYALHAAVLLAVVAVASACGLRRRPDLEEAAWKIGLVGALASSALALALAGVPALPAGDVEVASAQAARVQAAGTAGGSPPAGSAARRGRANAERVVFEMPLPAPTATAPLAVGRPNGAELDWRPAGWLVGVWLAGAALLLARLAVSWLALRRRLAGRRLLRAGRLRRLLDALLARAGRRRPVTLSASEQIELPFAVRREICLPSRLLRELEPDEQESVVAHELAHILRRDPLWLLAGRVLGVVFFFHPLVWLAARRLRQLAELRSDDWAAAATGRPLTLARTLTRVAGWGRTPLAASAAMAGGGSSLETRVTRLLSAERPAGGGAARRWLAAVGVAVLAGLVLWAPRVSAAGESRGTVPAPPAPPAAAPAPEAPAAAAPVVPPGAPAAPLLPRIAPLRPSAPGAPGSPAAPAPPLPALAVPAPGPVGLATAPRIGPLDIAIEPGVFGGVLPGMAVAPGIPPELAAGPLVGVELPVLAPVAVDNERLRELSARLAEESARLAAESARLAGAAVDGSELVRQVRERQQALAAEMLRTSQQFSREIAAAQEEAQRAVEEALRELRPEIERLAADGQLTAEERLRLDELRRELAPELEKLRRDLRPEIERLQRELRQELRPELERLRGELAPELDRLRQELRPELERLKQELAPELEKLRRELAPELERLRAELAEHAAERETLRAEVERLRRELAEQGERRGEPEQP